MVAPKIQDIRRVTRSDCKSRTKGSVGHKAEEKAENGHRHNETRHTRTEAISFSFFLAKNELRPAHTERENTARRKSFKKREGKKIIDIKMHTVYEHVGFSVAFFPSSLYIIIDNGHRVIKEVNWGFSGRSCCCCCCCCYLLFVSCNAVFCSRKICVNGPFLRRKKK